jgi:NDP-sugar pyrophosphorylase family protein
MQLDIRVFIERFSLLFDELKNKMPWEITNNLAEILTGRMGRLEKEYSVKDGIAIHSTAVIEQNVVLKGPIIVGKNCFIGANAYLRGPVFLDENVSIGAGCEIKQSIIFSSTAIAHFNYVGNSVVGSNVNFEAGSVAANHYNERKDKTISVLHEGSVINTQSNKFGSLIGDHSRVGANAVLSPGTILPKYSIVKRLELVEQLK